MWSYEHICSSGPEGLQAPARRARIDQEKKMSADTAQTADHQLLIAGQASNDGVE
jgi:hypothetical protein